MKKFNVFTGIDVSKSTLDFCIIDAKANVLIQGKTENNSHGIKLLLNHFKKLKVSLNEVLFSFENTGVYSMPLNIFLSERKCDFAEIPALEIKKSKGITRGKSDKTDAKDIALYGLRNLDKITLSSAPQIEILQLKFLFAEREKVIEAIKTFDSTNEAEGFLPNSVFKIVNPINRKILAHLKKALKSIEEKINKIIEQNEKLKQQKALLKSIPGIGDVTALYFLLATKGFSVFKDWRKFACYSGIAPFEYSSGSSVRARTKVNHFADKKIKSLLHLVALNAIKYDAELKEYYQRKRDEGKHTLLVLNNIKCKIVSRAFAVISRESPFVNTYKFAS